jgi:uncharacterized protein YggE
MRDMNRVGEAVAGATDAGANLLGGPNLRVSDPEAATRSAYAEAYRAARARAEAYAGAANLAITRVVAIYDGGGAVGPIPHGRDMNMERGVPTIDAVSAVAPQEAAPPRPPCRSAPASTGRSAGAGGFRTSEQ